MSTDAENQLQATNSYANIIRSSGPSTADCATCANKKLPKCFCHPKSGSEENETKQKVSAPTEIKNINSMQQISLFSTPYSRSFEETNKENPTLVLLVQQNEFQFTLKPNVKLIDIKALLEQFIK